MIFAQISDLHIKAPGTLAYGVFDPLPYLEACVDALNAFRPRLDFVVVTGDLVDTGLPEEYRVLQKALGRLTMPFFLLAGNHDLVPSLWATLGTTTDLLQPLVGSVLKRFTPGPEAVGLQYLADFGSAALVALDSSLPDDRNGGGLGPQRLEWLAETLAPLDHPAIFVAVHHPPFVTGISSMDRIGLRDSGAFWEVIAQKPGVTAVLSGHQHRSIETVVQGVWAGVCPAPAHQVALDLNPADHPRFVMEPPGFRIFQCTGSRFVSHTQPLGSFGPLYSFDEAENFADKH